MRFNHQISSKGHFTNVEDAESTKDLTRALNSGHESSSVSMEIISELERTSMSAEDFARAWEEYNRSFTL